MLEQVWQKESLVLLMIMVVPSVVKLGAVVELHAMTPGMLIFLW